MKITRRLVQFLFLVLTVVGVFLLQANCEKWCPFGGIESVYTYITEGNMTCSLGVSNFFILGGVVVSLILVRRAFCGYVCPIGTISNWIGDAAKWLGIKRITLPPALDRVLSLLKYPVLCIILYFGWRAGELLFRAYCPAYALLSRHGEDITFWAYVVAGGIVLCSLFFTIPFCRWLCPLAAVMNPLSRLGLTRVKRDENTCVDCGICRRACPMDIPVDTLKQVTTARCISCLQCTDSCPKKSDGALYWGPIGPSSWRWPQGLLVAVLLLCLGASVVASYMMPLPSFIKIRPDTASADTAPVEYATVELLVEDVTCRGRSNMLYYFLSRDDLYEIPGYLKLETWPDPVLARVRVTYDASQTDEAAVKSAICEAYYELEADNWRESPFKIKGYDSLGLDDINE